MKNKTVNDLIESRAEEYGSRDEKLAFLEGVDFMLSQTIEDIRKLKI